MHKLYPKLIMHCHIENLKHVTVLVCVIDLRYRWVAIPTLMQFKILKTLLSLQQETSLTKKHPFPQGHDEAKEGSCCCLLPLAMESCRFSLPTREFENWKLKWNTNYFFGHNEPYWYPEGQLNDWSPVKGSQLQWASPLTSLCWQPHKKNVYLLVFCYMKTKKMCFGKKRKLSNFSNR